MLPIAILTLALAPVPPQDFLAEASGWSMTRLDLVVHVQPWEERVVLEGQVRLRLEAESSRGPTLGLNARKPLLSFEEVSAPSGFEVELNTRFPGRKQVRLVEVRAGKSLARGAEVELYFRATSEGRGSQFAVTDEVAFASWTESWHGMPVPGPDERLSEKLAAPGTTTFHLPAGWHSVSNGRLVERTEDEFEVVEVWELDRPVARSFAAAPYHESIHEIDGRTIGVYRLGAGSGDAQAAMLARVLAAQEERFGPYPYASYRIAEIPPGAGDFMASSEQGMIMAKSVCFEPEDGNIALFGHEMAHGWWGNLLGGSGPGSILLSESLSQYSAALAIELVDGREAMTEFMRFSRPGYIPLQCARGYFELWRQGVDKPLIQLTSGGNDHQLSDAKGHWLFHMLRRRVGDQVFFATMRGILDDFEGSRWSVEILKERFLAAAPEAELATFFEQWLERSGAPVLDVEWAPVEGGVEVTIVHAGLGEPYHLWLDVEVEGSESTSVQRVDLREAVQTFTLACEGAPQGVRLDPEHELLIWTPEYGERPEQ